MSYVRLPGLDMSTRVHDMSDIKGTEAGKGAA